jgi:hypothetical protein
MHKETIKFYNNEIMRNEIRGILESEIDKLSIEYSKVGKDGSGLQGAYLALDSAFLKMKKIAK